MVSSVSSSKLPSSTDATFPTTAMAVLFVVSPPGFSQTIVTYFTKAPELFTWDSSAIDLTVPGKNSPVSCNSSNATAPTEIVLASLSKNGTFTVINLSLIIVPISALFFKISPFFTFKVLSAPSNWDL